MAIDKSLMAGSIGLMLLHLLEEGDMYGYQMVRELASRSDHTFEMKEGTLYPLLHQMEKAQWVTAYNVLADNGRQRKYYRLTPQGVKALAAKRAEWQQYTAAVNQVIGGVTYGY